MEQREFDGLPARIEALEAEQQRLHAVVAAPEFYKEPPDAIRTTLTRLEELQAELLAGLRALGRARFPAPQLTIRIGTNWKYRAKVAETESRPDPINA